MPPYAEFLGLIEEPGETAPLYRMPFTIGVTGRPGFLHGGALGGLLEMAAIGALKQALGSGVDENSGARIKPINVTMDYMRGGRDKPTFARATVTRLGNRIANVEALAWQDEPDRPIAAARMNYLISRQG
jgi:uncharacterized protein (TIGR00369 family)